MKFQFATLLLFLALLVPATGQVKNEDVLMTIGGKRVTVGEFLSIYHKNNPEGDNIDRKNLEEYLDLYINFKLKVKEAEDLGLDTLQSFKTELSGYRDQLAKPYFIDEATIDRLVKEAWEREKYDLRASHIFIRVKPDALPKDTLEAYEKISKIRDRVMKGEPFGSVAVEASDDPSARDREPNQQSPYVRGNRGDLGYFTVFDMVYPFESGTFNTPVGKVTPPVRTEYGYHIIRPTEKHDALGKVTVAHVFVMIPKNAKAEDSARARHQIDSVYLKLKAGGDWDDIVKKYSDDRGSAQKGGLLPKFGVNRMVPEFIEAIYNLKNVGDYSTPIVTPYGWHIIKLVERKAPGTFEEEKADLKQKVNKDGRSQLAREAVYQRIKKEYGYTEYPEARNAMLPFINDSIFLGNWNPAEAKKLNQLLFKIGNLVFRQHHFAQYLSEKQKKQEKMNLEYYVNKMYRDYVEESLVTFENAHLEEKYPEFRNLLGEYRDGILLFDLTDQKVWSKAVKDTTGLMEFYEKNRSNYLWGERLNASVYTVKDPSMVRKVKNFISTGLQDDALLKEINGDTLKILSIESGKFSRGENRIIDTVAWVPGISQDIQSGHAVAFVNVREVLAPEPKTLNDARGLITADYQNYLEKLWIEALRQKYPVTVNREILANIK